MGQKTNKLICGDVFATLQNLNVRFNCLIADIPDNINLKYGAYQDKISHEDYRLLLARCFTYFPLYSDISWISFNSRHIFDVGDIISKSKTYYKDYEHKLIINVFTFGQNNNNDCGNGYRPLLRIKHKDAPLYPDAIKVPSWRQLNGDKRAKPGGKVPLDAWDFERVTGNSKERRSWHPTQLKEAMIKRIINFSTVPGDRVCDAFSGTGTVLRACDDRDITSIEIDGDYCSHIISEHPSMTYINY